MNRPNESSPFVGDERGHAASAGSPDATATGIHELVIGSWCRVLRAERIGLTENFFDLGGTSLSAIELCSSLNESLGLEIDARTLFRYPTLESFLDAVAPRASLGGGGIGNIGADGESWPVLPSHGWFFSQPFASAQGFCVGLIFRAASEIRFDILRRAIAVVVNRHDALRTQFRQIEDHWEQVPVNEDIPVTHHDLTDLTEADQLHRTRAIGKEMAQSFSFGRGPLIRFATIACGGGRGSRLLIVAHHLLADFSSWQIIVEDIESLYLSLLAGSPRDESALPITTSVRAWATWLNGPAALAEALREASYWRRPRPTLELPLGQPTGTPRQEYVRRIVGEAMASAVVVYARERGVNPDVVLLTAFARVLAEWCATDHVTLDVISHGRTPTPRGFSLSRTVGWLTRQTPLHIDFPPDAGATTAVEAVVMGLDSRPRDGIGYSTLRFSQRIPKHERRSLPADCAVGFNFLGTSTSRYRGLELFAPASEDTGVRREHPPLRTLELACALIDRQVVTTWSFDGSLLSRAAIDRLSQRLEHHATLLVTSIERRDAEYR